MERTTIFYFTQFVKFIAKMLYSILHGYTKLQRYLSMLSLSKLSANPASPTSFRHESILVMGKPEVPCKKHSRVSSSNKTGVELEITVQLGPKLLHRLTHSAGFLDEGPVRTRGLYFESPENLPGAKSQLSNCNPLVLKR